MNIKPRALLFDLFGGHLRYLGGEARVQVFTELLDVFAIPEPTTRVALARMRKEGWFTTRRDGRQTIYSLTDQSWRLLDEGRTRIFRDVPETWDGKWRMVIYTVPEDAREERERLRRTLAWHGFGALTAATWVSTHPRLDDIATALGEDPAIRLDLLTCRSRGLDHDRAMASRCWDLAGLASDYTEFVRAYDELPSPPELRQLPGREALRLQIELVSAYRSFPFRDPDLPDALLPEGWPGREVHRRFIATHEALNEPARAYVLQTIERSN